MEESKTLHLNLVKKWFDMTLKEAKKEDYRDITQYWLKRIFGFNLIDGYTRQKSIHIYDTITQNVDLFLENNNPIDFDTTTLSNGMASDAPRFTTKFKGIEIREGKKEWGAEPGKKYFVIKHGEILDIRKPDK